MSTKRKPDSYIYRNRMDTGTKVFLVGIALICLLTGICVIYLNHERDAQKLADANYVPVKPTVPTTETLVPPAETEKVAASPKERAAVLSPARPEIQTESIDSRGIKHRIIEEDETLCRISKKEYGTTAFAIAIAWFNGFDDPSHILKDSKIMLPPEEKLLSAPFGWPEVPATPEQIASRSLLEGEEQVATSESTDAAQTEDDPERLTDQPRTTQSPAICATKHHVVVKGEFTIWDVAENEYHLDLYGLGLALGAANRFEGRYRLSLGEEIVIPCLGEIRPANQMYSLATASEREDRKQ